jgi:hypothetical protein
MAGGSEQVFTSSEKPDGIDHVFQDVPNRYRIKRCWRKHGLFQGAAMNLAHTSKRGSGICVQRLRGLDPFDGPACASGEPQEQARGASHIQYASWTLMALEDPKMSSSGLGAAGALCFVDLRVHASIGVGYLVLCGSELAKTETAKRTAQDPAVRNRFSRRPDGSWIKCLGIVVEIQPELLAAA